MNNFTTRILSGIVYAFFIFLGTHFYGYDLIHKLVPHLDSRYIYLAFITLCYLLCSYELVRIMQFESWVFKLLAIAAGVLPLYYFGMQLMGVGAGFYFAFRKLLFIAPILVAFITIFKFPEELDNIDSSKIIFFVCYLGMPFGLALLLQNFGSLFPSEVFYLFVLIWASDSFAYLIGKKWGKTPLAPSISPKKTKEGLLGGILGTLIVGALIQNTIGYLNGNWIIIALIVSLCAPIGDLAESKLKRTFGVKDSGALIPGHGGLLDRLDSFIAVVPMVYLYLLLDNLF